MKSVAVIIPVLLLLASCANKYHRFVKEYTFKSASGKPDYTQLDYWAAHPYKKNPADSIPKPLREKNNTDTTIDIFFIHPTTYTDKEKKEGWNAPIDDAEINSKTDYSSILYQASVFNNAGRIFAPRYRQANYWSYFPQSGEDTINATHAFEIAYEDVKTAFEYYLRQWNKGRPIIIAAHSQGTTHAKRLLKEFFETTALKDKLVVAYIVGIPIEPDYFSVLKPCEKPDETGCFCGWRTLQSGYKPDYILKEKYASVVTNPLTWDSSKPFADRFLNKGSVLLNFNKIIPHAAAANTQDGVLFTPKPRFFGNLFYTAKNYHIADYNLYYISIRENVALRVKAFLK